MEYEDTATIGEYNGTPISKEDHEQTRIWQ